MKALVTVRFKKGTSIGPDAVMEWARQEFKSSFVKRLIAKERHGRALAAAKSREDLAGEILAVARAEKEGVDDAFLAAEVLRDESIALQRRRLVIATAAELKARTNAISAHETIELLKDRMENADGGQAGIAYRKAIDAKQEAEEAQLVVWVAFVTARSEHDRIRAKMIDIESVSYEDVDAWAAKHCLIPDKSMRHYRLDGDILVLADRNGTELIYGPDGFPEPSWWTECPFKEQVDHIEVRVVWAAHDRYKLGYMRSHAGEGAALAATLEYVSRSKGGAYVLKFRMPEWSQIEPFVQLVRSHGVSFSNTWSRDS